MLKEKYKSLAFIVISLGALGLAGYVSGCQCNGTPVDNATALRFPTTGWPIDNTAVVHEIGNSAGEFQQYDPARPVPYFHGGIDILDDSAPSGPWVRAVREGIPTLSTLSYGSLNNGLTMTHADGDTYLYWHLDYNSIEQGVRDADDDGTTLAANSLVARLVTWPSCGYHHLHYEISDSLGRMDPIFTLSPRNDTTSSVIENVFFTQNATNNQFTTDPSGTPNLSGNVDIIMQCYDTQFGTARTGVMQLSYKVTDTGGNEVKSPVTISFQNIPSDANVSIIYRNSPPFDSDSSYCSTENYYYVLTNVDAMGNIISDTSGFWDTSALTNGAYQVHVTAEDASGNEFTAIEQINIDN